jgi:hypothetical protein
LGPIASTTWEIVLVTTGSHTPVFYIQSPRLQTAFPISVSENLYVHIPATPYVPVHVDFDIVFGPNPGVKVTSMHFGHSHLDAASPSPIH